MKHLFIVNPIAGGKDKSAEVRAKVESAFRTRADSYEVYVTKAPMDAVDKIRREAASGEELRVYACGGDGTFNECVNGAALLPNVAVCPFPTGTGNDFCRTFGAEQELFRDLGAILDGDEHPIDLIDCNGRYSVNICSVGIDARIGTDVHKYSALPLLGGKMAYITSAAVNLFKGVREPLRVMCAGKHYDGDMSLICACNGSYYGGGFHPVPEARPDDGALDFLIVKGVSRLSFVKLIGAYSKGRYADMPTVITHVRGDRIEIESDAELPVNVDGELIFGKKVVMQLLPGAVNFLVPKNMAFFRAQPEAVRV